MLQKSFWEGERNFLEPLMRFTSGDVRDHIVSSKIDQDFRSSVEKQHSGGEVQRPTFARFSGSLGFRLLQQYLPEAVAISSAPITHSSGQDWCVGCGLYLRSLGALMSKSIQKKMRMLHYSDHDERVTAQI
jgi:UDP-N-acetylglucosamine:LPS N-acetylglucosamine transferase